MQHIDLNLIKDTLIRKERNTGNECKEEKSLENYEAKEGRNYVHK